MKENSAKAYKNERKASSSHKDIKYKKANENLCYAHKRERKFKKKLIDENKFQQKENKHMRDLDNIIQISRMTN